MRNVIVTRHAGAIAWLQARGYEGQVNQHFDIEDARPGIRIIGVLPLPLIRRALAAGAEVLLLSMPAMLAKHRGKELSPAEMEEAGARLERVSLLSLDERTCTLHFEEVGNEIQHS